MARRPPRALLNRGELPRALMAAVEGGAHPGRPGRRRRRGSSRSGAAQCDASIFADGDDDGAV